MGGLTVALRGLNQTASKVATSKGLRQLYALEKADAENVERILGKAGQALKASASKILLDTFRQAGLKTRSGTMQRALSNLIVDATARRVVISMASGVRYPGEKSGNVYAAAGMWRFGGIRQPLTKGAGTLYRDLPTGQLRVRKKAAGALSAKVKARLKKQILAGNTTGTSAQRLEKAGATVIPPKKPFFEINEAQRQELNRIWADAVKAELKAVGIQVQ